MKNNRITLILILALAVGVTTLPGGIGSVGFTGDSAVGGFTVSAEFNPLCAITTVFGDAPADVRDDLVAEINANCTGFTATAVGLAGDFEVTHDDLKDVDGLAVCKDDPGLTRVRSEFPDGRMKGKIGRVKETPAGDGTLRVIVECHNAPDFDQTFDTSVPPNNTIAGLNQSVETALTGAGFNVEGNGNDLWVFCPASLVDAIEIRDSDTGISSTCTTVMGKSGPVVPTLSQVGMFLLVLLVTGAAIVLLRRREAASR